MGTGLCLESACALRSWEGAPCPAAGDFLVSVLTYLAVQVDVLKSVKDQIA